MREKIKLYQLEQQLAELEFDYETERKRLDYIENKRELGKTHGIIEGIIKFIADLFFDRSDFYRAKHRMPSELRNETLGNFSSGNLNREQEEVEANLSRLNGQMMELKREIQQLEEIIANEEEMQSGGESRIR